MMAVPLEAEVDAQFRTMTSSCKAYSRCMEMRGYNESECSASMDRWRDAEASFATLSREIRMIDAEVEKLKIIAEAASKKRRDPSSRHPVARPPGRPSEKRCLS